MSGRRQALARLLCGTLATRAAAGFAKKTTRKTPNGSARMSELKSKHLFDLTIQLHPIIEVGATPAGERRIVPVSGGQFTGERLRGEVLSHAGSDLLLARTDGSFQQDVRLALRTDDGAVILMTYPALRPPPPDANPPIPPPAPV